MSRPLRSEDAASSPGNGGAAVPLVVLAPMAGVTDSAMRVISGRMGAQAGYTEMVSAEGLRHDSLRTSQLLERLPCEAPPVAHIYGADPGAMGDAADAIGQMGGFAGVDINAGCPVRKVMKCGGGAALMPNPVLVGRIVSAMSARTNLPVTLKTRIGMHPGAVTIFDIIKAVEDGGGAGIALHGRFASAGHGGDVNVELLRRAVEATKLPVIVNGGVKTAADATSLLSATGAAGVMVGRGAMGNPWLFSEIRAALAGGGVSTLPRRPGQEILAKLKEQLELSLEFKRQLISRYPAEVCTCDDPELSAVHDFRHYMFNYFKGWPGSVELRRQMCGYTSFAELMDAISRHIGLS